MTFQELHDIMKRIRDKEKEENPIVLLQTDEFEIQIYANEPLCFNFYSGGRAKAEPELQIREHNDSERKKFVAYLRQSPESVEIIKKSYEFDENIERLVVEFPDDPHMRKIVENLQNIHHTWQDRL